MHFPNPRLITTNNKLTYMYMYEIYSFPFSRNYSATTITRANEDTVGQSDYGKILIH